MKNRIYKLDFLETIGPKWGKIGKWEQKTEDLKNTGPLGKVWPMGSWKLEESYEKGVA